MRHLSLLVITWALSGCYHFAVNRPSGHAEGFVEKKTYLALWWGIKQPKISTKVCERSNALAKVKTTTNFGYALITVITAGIVAPINVEFVCAEQQTNWKK